jgi:hypothetical protein
MVQRIALLRHAVHPHVLPSARPMSSRRDSAKTGLHRPFPDEDKPARKRVRSERARFLKNDRRRVRWALEPDYRDGKRARRYGLTLAEYRALQARQGNVCAICRKRARVLCIDHCHLTGRVRGLLCPKCNSALGFCDDDPQLLRAALAYLLATAKV